MDGDLRALADEAHERAVRADIEDVGSDVDRNAATLCGGYPGRSLAEVAEELRFTARRLREHAQECEAIAQRIERRAARRAF